MVKGISGFVNCLCESFFAASDEILSTFAMLRPVRTQQRCELLMIASDDSMAITSELMSQLYPVNGNISRLSVSCKLQNWLDTEAKQLDKSEPRSSFL